MTSDPRIWTIVLCLLALVGCKDDPETITGSVSFIQGAASTASTAAATAGVAPEGFYSLSPDLARVTLVGLGFSGPVGSDQAEAALNHCTVEYDRTAASGSQLLTCEYTVPVGTYYELGVIFDEAIDVLISDSVNGFFTDPASGTLFSGTEPVGGADYIELVTQSIDGVLSLGVPLLEPLVVTSDDPPAVSLIVDMLRTIQADVDAAGAITFEKDLTRPVDLTATLGNTGFSEYYLEDASGLPNGLRFNEGLKIYYAATDAPVRLAGGTGYCGAGDNRPGESYAWSPEDPAYSGAGYYLGLDNGTLAWALGRDDGDVSVYDLARPTTVGDPTQMRCRTLPVAPAPVTGSTYAGGIPPEVQSTPDETLDLVLAAN